MSETTDAPATMLSDWFSPEELQRRNPSVFPTLGSLRWFLRGHERNELGRRGVVRRIGRRVLINEPRLANLIQVRIPDERDRRFRLNVTGDSGRT